MSGSVQIISLLSLLFALCRANQFAESHVVSQVFAGSPSTCRLPNSTYCGVDYSVPDNIATLVRVIEEEIRGVLEFGLMPGEELNPCQRTRKEIQCAQRFPKCMDGNVVLTSTPNCETKVRENCADDADNLLVQSHYCGLEDAVIPMGTCSALNSFSSESVLNHCGVIGNHTLVTEWMFKLIDFTDTQLLNIIGPDSSLGQGGPACSDDHARYSCQLLGECSEDSAQITLRNDYHFCEGTLTCYDYNFAEGARPYFPCVKWDELDHPIPETLTIPPSTVIVNEVTTPSPGGPGGVPSIIPSDIPLPFNAARTLHSVGHILLSVCVACVFFLLSALLL